MNPVKQELKTEFQLERIIFFSDAVFAIAITLLIIEVHVPQVTVDTNASLLVAIGTILPDLFGFVTSFFLIACFWHQHHSIFGYAEGFDAGLIWLNLGFLFFIVLIPFTTSLMGPYGNLLVATTLYSINIICAGLLNMLLLRHLVRSPKKLSAGLENRRLLKGFYIFLLAIPVWILVCWLVGLLTVPGIGDFCLFGLAFVIPFSKKLGQRAENSK